MSEKSFIVIGAGELQIPLILAAKNLELTVIATDKNHQAPGFQYADVSIIADTMNPQESLEQLIEYSKTNRLFHGVATTGTDASLTVALIAKHFALPGHDPSAVLHATNKGLMRKTLEQHKVPIPQYKIISQLEDASDFFNELQAPCIIKPINNMGARGVSIASNIKELSEAFTLAQEYSGESTEILIEEYLDAHELSIDALVHNGMITITGIADRIIEYPPYCVETGHILPSSLGEEWIERAILTFRDGIKALRLTHGAAKADLKISKTNTWIIEIAARLSGGFMSSHTFPFATGIPLQEYMVKLALGEDIGDLIPNKNLVSIERAIIIAPGLIKKIYIPENILEQQYISHFSFKAKEGELISPPKNNLDKQGNIIATAPTRELALRAINQALGTVKVELEDHEVYQENIHADDPQKTCQTSFREESNDLNHIKLIPSYIHEVHRVDSTIQLFGTEFSMPILIAPREGFGNELALQRSLIKGAKQAGVLALAPDPISDDNFPIIAQVILENFGHSMIIAKPRTNLEDINKRFKIAVEAGALGLGININEIRLKSMPYTQAKSIEILKELCHLYQLPFIVRGILSDTDAQKAVEAGATHIILSSPEDWMRESFPSAINMLPQIRKTINIPILLEGTISSGADVIKALSLGADAVVISQTATINISSHETVTSYLNVLKDQIQTLMLSLGVSSIEELKNRSDILLINPNH
ncbi:MAG: alpha-hydroxy-acid oxidizing protein [Brevinema sp.]